MDIEYEVKITIPGGALRYESGDAEAFTTSVLAAAAENLPFDLVDDLLTGIGPGDSLIVQVIIGADFHG